MALQVYIAGAGQKGEGVFAQGKIPAETLVITFTGTEEWIWSIPRADWEYALQVAYDRYILPERESPAWFLNHSCDPSCVLVGRTDVKSWRRIAKGEELTIDYSTNVGWDEFEMACRCGSPNCRRLIRSYRFLPADRKRAYGRNVSPYLLEKRT